MNRCRALLRLVLIAVFVHTCIGLPLHEAEHFQAAARGGQDAAVIAAQDDAPPASKPIHAQEHGPCAGCMAFAQPSVLPGGIQAAMAADCAVARCPQPEAAFAFVPAPDRWPFASRDPPVRLA